MFDIEKIIIVIVTYFLLYLIWVFYQERNHSFVKSKIDGNSYRVRNLNDKVDQKTADLIAKIVKKINLLIKHLEKTFPDDERTILLTTRFDPKNITEGNGEKNVTSYSINKGEKIVLCLRNRDDNSKLIDLNTILFVVIHELGHVISKSIGHTDEFWDNFKWLLDEAINIGIYQYEDYDINPVKYCGMTITSTVAENPHNK
jgi:hypothetical protein